MQTSEKNARQADERMDGLFDDLQQAMNRVDLWAAALIGLLQPVPQGAYRLPRESR
jgi:hypothetical protein